MNRQTIQILRGAKTYDPSTSQEVLADGQPFYSKKTSHLYVGNGEEPIKDLTAVNDPQSIRFTKDIYTAFNIGSVAGSSNDRKKLFQAGETLAEAFDRIFDITEQPTITQPNLTLSTSENSVTGELGASWPTITTNTSRTDGSYSFGPDNTGVTWVGSPIITTSGNTSGIFGNGKRTYKAEQSYTATGVIALDNKGNASNPEQKIVSGSDTATKDVTEAVQYRYFYGNVSGTTTSEILTNLKNIKTSTDSLKTFLAKQSSITVTLNSNGYIYFVSKDAINGASMGGFEFPITKMGTATFTNSYGKTYSVNVYKSSSEQTPNTYTIKLS